MGKVLQNRMRERFERGGEKKTETVKKRGREKNAGKGETARSRKRCNGKNELGGGQKKSNGGGMVKEQPAELACSYEQVLDGSGGFGQSGKTRQKEGPSPSKKGKRLERNRVSGREREVRLAEFLTVPASRGKRGPSSKVVKGKGNGGGGWPKKKHTGAA